MTSKNKKNKTFITYTDDFEFVKQLNDNQAGKLFKKLFLETREEKSEDISKDPVLTMVFNALKSKIDRDKEAYEKKCEQMRANASKSKQKVAKASKSPIDTDIDTDIDIVSKKKKNIKKEKYGEFKNVKLSKTEYDKLIQIYKGNHDLLKAIEILDSYVESKGKSYKSHYAVLGKTQWVYKKVFDGGGGGEKKKSQMQRNRELMIKELGLTKEVKDVERNAIN